MLKARISMLDVAYFLIDKYDYQRMNVINPDLDLWLVNKKSNEYPIVRLTALSLAEGVRQKADVIKQADHISNLLNVKESVLSIHFNKQRQIEVIDDDYKQAHIGEDYITDFLEKDFIGIKNSLRPIGEDLQSELKRRELKIMDLDNKPKKLNKFSLSMIGPTQILIGLNLIVFLAAAFLKMDYGSSITAVMLGGLYKNFVYGANEWWRLITAGFLHVDLFHIMMNMIVLFQAGALVERVYGKKNMSIIFIVSILTSSLLSLVMMDGGTVSLGASGGVFGLMGAIIVYVFSSNLHKVPRIRSSIISTLFANLLISLLPGISFWGHLGGFIGGLLVAVAVSSAETLKPARVHAMVSLSLVIGGMLGYSFALDDNVYNIEPKLDQLTIRAFDELGLDSYANHLEKNMIIYYESIGEFYE